MKWSSRHERSNPALGGIGAGIILSMGAVSLAEVLSAAPRHAAVQAVVIVGFAVGAVLTYLGRAAKPSGSDARP
jgi:hypothetical protein